MRFPSVLHLLTQADIWHSKAILLFLLLNNWNSSLFPLKPHEKSFFSSILEANLIVKVVKVPTRWFEYMYAWRTEGLWVHARSWIILSQMHYWRYGDLAKWHRGSGRMSGLSVGQAASGERYQRLPYIWTLLRCLFSLQSCPLPHPSPFLLFPSSHHLNYMCLEFVIPAVCLSALLCLWLPPLCCIDMRIPALPGGKCNLIIIKQLAGDAVCV